MLEQRNCKDFTFKWQNLRYHLWLDCNNSTQNIWDNCFCWTNSRELHSRSLCTRWRWLCISSYGFKNLQMCTSNVDSRMQWKQKNFTNWKRLVHSLHENKIFYTNFKNAHTWVAAHFVSSIEKISTRKSHFVHWWWFNYVGWIGPAGRSGRFSGGGGWLTKKLFSIFSLLAE